MCGIWFSIGAHAPESVISVISHRGPDGHGWKAFDGPRGPVYLGHRRLAIIDLDERSAQPMVAPSGRTWITFNGEIYNYRELRDELRALGYCFLTESDTEVILNAWEAWGENCLKRFVGMFAFVIYEPEIGKAFVARDNFGIKPLYFWKNGGVLCVASEIKQFFEMPGFEARMNGARVYDFLMSGLVGQTNETTFAGVFQLRAGHCAVIDTFSNNWTAPLAPRRWYHLPEPGSLKMPFEEAGERFLELFTESVRMHLRADVTVGSCLSGGLDSSAIVVTMGRLLAAEGHSDKIHTVSSCFEEKAVDERTFIAEVVRASGARSSYVFPRWEDLPPLLDRITWHQDEPFGSTSIYAQWCVFQCAATEGLKVMLDGQGADEQLAGYHGVFPVYLAQLLRERRISEYVRTALGRTAHHGQSLLPQLRPLLGEKQFAILARLLRFREASTAAYPNFVSPDAFPEADRSKPPYLIAMHRDGLESLDTVGELCRALTQTVNLPVLLHFEDRNSMAHSIEARVPFLDHRLVDFTIALGSEHKVVRHLTKAVLRRAMRDHLPPKVLNRQDKLGFPAPEEIWFKGPLRPWVEETLEQSLKALNGLLQPAVVRDYAKQVLDGARPFDNTLWRILHLGTWQRVFRVGV